MIQISEAAQSHFRKLIEREAIPGLGVRLAAVTAAVLNGASIVRVHDVAACRKACLVADEVKEA